MIIIFLCRHWIAVFGLLMNRSYHGIVKKFTEHVQSRHGENSCLPTLSPHSICIAGKVPEASTLQDFLTSSVVFLNCFPKRPE